MSYAILDPHDAAEERKRTCALAIMAKAPRAGRVKTRLAPPLTLEQSAALNICFLRDTARNIATIAAEGGAAGVICYTPVGDEAAFDGLFPDHFVLIPQRGDAFGERLLCAAQDILAYGYGAVCLIDSDSPTMPAASLRQAVEELTKSGDRVVLGGSDDGGYYLIGLKAPHAAPFERITWSTGSVYAETVERVRQAGLELVELPVWYDVDDGATLAVLRAELLRGERPAFATVDGYNAVATRRFLQTLESEGVAAGGRTLMPFLQLDYDGVQDFRNGRAWFTNIVLSAIGFGLLCLTRQMISETDHFTIGFSGASGWSTILYFAAVAVVLTQPVNRWTFWIIVAFGVLCRLVDLNAEPYLSTDIYRYVWDGIVQHAHVNPYHYVPGDAALSFLREPNQDVFDNINRRDYARTIYPPFAQMIYFLATWISPTVAMMKTTMFGFECLSVWGIVALLKRLGRPREQALLYAWCPLLIWEIGDAGHIDAAVIAFVVLALLFRSRDNSALVGLFLGLAVMIKFYPLILFPALYRRGDWKMPAMMAGLAAVGYAVYSSVGMMVFGFMGGYTKEEGLDTGTRYFLQQLAQSWHGAQWVSMPVFLGFCAVVFGAITWWAWTHATVEGAVNLSVRAGARVGEEPAFLKATCMLATALMLLFSPHYPWYVAWLVPLFCLAPNVPMMAYTLGCFYAFTTQWADPGPKFFMLNKMLYAGVALAFVVHYALRRWPVHRIVHPQYRRESAL